MAGAINDVMGRPFRSSPGAAAPLLLVLLLGCATTVPSGEPAPRVRADVVCRVNGSKIYRSDVEAEKQKLLPAAAFHRSVDDIDQQAMRRDALQNLIDQEIEYQDARRRAIVVDREEVEREYTRVAERYGGTKTFEARIERSGIESSEVIAALERKFLIARVKDVVADGVPEVSEQDTLRYFDEHAESFRLARRAQTQQVLFHMPPLERDPDDWQRAIARANELRARVEAGESFAKLAAEISDSPEDGRAEGGSLGVVHPGQLAQPLDTALWSLQPGEVSKPIREFKGVYLLSVDHFIEARQLSYDEIETRLEKLVLKNRRQQAVIEWRVGLRERAEIEIIDPSLAPLTESATSGP